MQGFSIVQGFLNLNKPFGLTSHDCVARVRRLLRQKRVGHGGTLDPAAMGVLPIAVGRATRLLQYLSHQKAYRATIRFGVVTTTDDLEGEVISQTPAADLTLAQVQQVLPQFKGKIEQIPPSYSAIQVDGKRLYDLARSGQTVTAPVRTVEVHQIQVLDWRPGEFPELEVEIACGTGTYIRSIARDLGAVLGTGGTLAALLRTASSRFELSDSLTLEQVAEQMASAQFNLVPPLTALNHLPVLALPEAEAKRWQQGQRIAGEAVTPLTTDPGADGPYVIQQTTDRQFLGIGQVINTDSGKLLMPKLVWDN